VTLRVKVIPRSKKNEVSGELADGTVMVHVTAPPEKGISDRVGEFSDVLALLD
jgi:uncharacterized protein YggU (UPF0235/DUF167 family)